MIIMYGVIWYQDSPYTRILNSVEEPESDSDVLIECKNVYKSFGEKHILRGVSFKVMPILAILVFKNCWMPFLRMIILTAILLVD